jgi:hypothetical protein
MILAAFILTWWTMFGLVVGNCRARNFYSPDNGFYWSAAWAFGWPYLWLLESADGR